MHRLSMAGTYSALSGLLIATVCYSQSGEITSNDRGPHNAELEINDRYIATTTKSISTRRFELPFTSDRDRDVSFGNRRADLYGTEAIPHLEHVIPQLPSELQTSLKNDRQVAQCIERTRSYYRDVYKRGRLDPVQTAQTVRDHDKDCLRPFPPVSPALTDVNPEFGAVGILFSRSRNTFYCTATLVSDRLLVTARHCAYLPMRPPGIDASALEEAASYQINIPSDILFYSVAKPSVQMEVAAFVNEDGNSVSPPEVMPEVNQANDVIFLKLTADVSGISPASLALKRPLIGEPMIVPGFYSRLATLDAGPGATKSPESKPADRMKWSAYMRYDPLNTCRVVRVGLRCIFNGCQTDSGWSGAPVFVGDGTNTGRLVIVGIVSGSLVENSDCRAELGEGNNAVFGANSDIPNVAVIVSGQ